MCECSKTIPINRRSARAGFETSADDDEFDVCACSARMRAHLEDQYDAMSHYVSVDALGKIRSLNGYENCVKIMIMNLNMFFLK